MAPRRCCRREWWWRLWPVVVVSPSLAGSISPQAKPPPPLPSTAPPGVPLPSSTLKEGDYITEGGAIVKLAGLSTVWIEAQVYTSQLSQFNRIGTVNVQFPDLPGKTLQGKIAFVSPEVNPDNRINLIRVEVPNKDNLLRPGMPAYVTLKAPQRKTLSLPPTPSSEMVKCPLLGTDGTKHVQKPNGGNRPGGRWLHRNKIRPATR